MNIQLKGTHIDLTPAIKAYCEEKMSSIEKMLPNLDPMGSAELHIELARTTAHHHKGDIFMAETQLTLPKKTFHVSETRDDMYAAIDAVKDTLHHALERYKDTLISERRG